MSETHGKKKHPLVFPTPTSRVSVSWRLHRYTAGSLKKTPTKKKQMEEIRLDPVNGRSHWPEPLMFTHSILAGLAVARHNTVSPKR